MPGTELAKIESYTVRAGRDARQAGAREKERAFVGAYVSNGYNGTAAAIAAGYKAHTARFAASKMLARPRVKEALDRIFAPAISTAAEVVHLSCELMRFSPADWLDRPDAFVIDSRGRQRINWKLVKELGIGHMVKEIKRDRNGDEVPVWHSQSEAAERVAKILGLTRDRLDVRITDVRQMSDEELAAMAGR
jgi:phage terminase small subunit